MHLGFHGGLCCGIKTIYGFPVKPEGNVYELEKTSINNADQQGNQVSSNDRFYHLEAPKEPALDRLKRYIDYLKEHRPQGIVEVVLAETTEESYKTYCQYTNWNDTLLELGFKESVSARNCNSGNIVHVYHLVIADPYDYDDDDDF